MTAEVPRRLRPTAGQRQRTILTHTKGAPSGQGSTSSARPVAPAVRSHKYVPPAAPPTPPPDANVLTGTSSGTDSTSITSTSAGAGGSSATGFRAIAMGNDATASSAYAVAIGGGGATASGNSSLALGVGAQASGTSSVGIINNSSTGQNSFAFAPGADATANDAIAFGSSSQATATGAWAQTGAQASGTYSIAAGYSPDAASNRGARATKKVAIALGGNTYANGVGSVALGTDSSGTGASTSTDNEIALGTANHIAIVKGKLVIADSSGGLHQIVCSTGGALSTVAYP